MFDENGQEKMCVNGNFPNILKNKYNIETVKRLFCCMCVHKMRMLSFASKVPKLLLYVPTYLLPFINTHDKNTAIHNVGN